MNQNETTIEDFYRIDIEDLEKGLREAFEEIRIDQLGSNDDGRTEFLLNCLKEFADFSITCTTKDPATKNIVEVEVEPDLDNMWKEELDFDVVKVENHFNSSEAEN